KGALKAHRVLIGNAPGFVHSHDFFPQRGDLFWSPADWAWTGGLMDALLPSWMFGVPILGYRGRFDAERAFYLLDKYGVRNSFLFPTALKLMMKAVPEPRKKYQLGLRSIMSAGESVGVTGIEWAKAELGVTINEMFGHTETDADGYFWYQGRSDDVIKSAGYRIGPAEIESCLVKHRAVANAAVIGKPDATRGAIVKAFIVLQPGESPSQALIEEIQGHVRGR